MGGPDDTVGGVKSVSVLPPQLTPVVDSTSHGSVGHGSPMDRSIRSRHGATKNSVFPFGFRRQATMRTASIVSPVWKSMSKMTPRQTLHMLHRFVTLATALLYLTVALDGVIATLETLVGVVNPPLSDSSEYNTALVGQLAGSSAVRDSLLMQNLDFQLAPRNDTMYVDLDGSYVSFTGCSKETTADAIYSNTFLREVYDQLVQNTVHRAPFLDLTASKLIVPVVDCTSSAIEYEDTSVAKIFYLVRNLQPDPVLNGSDQVALVTLAISNQVYEVPNHDERGPISIGTMAILFTMESTSSDVEYIFIGSVGYPFKKLNFRVYEYLEHTADSYWKLRQVPKYSGDEVAQTIVTTCRTGFYCHSPSYQSNINQELWELPADPVGAVSHMNWAGVPTTTNVWSWVHLVHLVFDIQTLTQLVILLVVIYRNWQVGKLWVGDAFSPIANTLMLRGACVLIAWCVDGFWTVTEHCMAVGYAITGNEEVFVHNSIMHADLMTVFLTCTGLAGKLLHERIDPPLTMLLFELGYQLTPHIIRAIPSALADLTAKIGADYAMGVVTRDVDMSSVSPMGLWSAHKLVDGTNELVAITFAPLLITFALLIVLVLCQKFRRRLKRPKVASHSRARRSSLRFLRTAVQPPNSTGSTSERAERLLSTQFELATGVELSRRYGVLCNYESARLVKGLVFASADGVYSSGFVIVNERFLVATADLVDILLMKLLRLRYRSIYVYDVQGHHVQAMARLMYPGTLSLRDLARLNITMLS